MELKRIQRVHQKAQRKKLQKVLVTTHPYKKPT
jgi:hypothetical protein